MEAGVKIFEEIAEGKTKEIYRVEPGVVKIVSKPVITAGDGAKKDPIEGKDGWANNTTVNVFELLNKHGIKTHFIKRAGETAFLAFECAMIPIEVVGRRIGTGSYLKRNPKIPDGTVFDELVVEFFYKDDELHDPIIYKGTITPEWQLHKADQPKDFYAFEPDRSSSYIKTIIPCLAWEEAAYIEKQTEQIFLILEETWKELGITLWDFKIEFGRRKDSGEIVLADVIDNDSWRIRTEDGQQLDKQRYRDGADMKEVRNIYEIVSNMTNQW